MPNLHINANPRFTTYVVDEGILSSSSFVVFDCGARGGLDKYWEVLGYTLRAIAFEPDEKECKKLNRANRDKGIYFYPYYLSNYMREKYFYHAKYPYASSFFKPNQELTKQLLINEEIEPVNFEKVQTITLKDFCSENSIQYIDFIKLDTEGSELEILDGLGSLLNDVFGVLSEFRFQKILDKAPTFTDLMTFLEFRGFEIYDIDVYRLARKVLPLPYLYDFRDDNNRFVAGPSAFGQVMMGDALFFNSLHENNFNLEREIKKIMMLELFGMNDVAIYVLLSHKEKFADVLSIDKSLNALVPEIKGKQLTYTEYMEEYLKNPLFFRPKSGYRYREKIYDHYE